MSIITRKLYPIALVLGLALLAGCGNRVDPDADPLVKNVSAPQAAQAMRSTSTLVRTHKSGLSERDEVDGIEITKNGSFEAWDDKLLLPSYWELKAGKVSRAGEATEGSSALQLDPVTSGGTRVLLCMRSNPPVKGKRLVVLMDAKCAEDAPPGELIFQVQAQVKGDFKGISKNPTNPENPWVPYAHPGGGWYMMKHEIELTPDMDLSDIRLTLYLLASAKTPALVDNVAVYVCE